MIWARRNGVIYKFRVFTRQSCDNITLDSDKRKVPISEYFACGYCIRLKHGSYLCVKAYPERDTYIMLKFCKLAERQQVLELATPEQTSTMARSAHTRSMEKREAASDELHLLDHNRNLLCRDFGITVEISSTKENGLTCSWMSNNVVRTAVPDIVLWLHNFCQKIGRLRLDGGREHTFTALSIS